MKTIWSRNDRLAVLVQPGDNPDDLSLRVPGSRGVTITRGLNRLEALALATAIQAHYAEADQR